jgi:hypothetical protein
MVDSTLFHTSTPTLEGLPLPTWRRAFLAAFCLNGNVSDAARAAGIDRTTAYKAKKADPSFAEEWAVAEEIASDALLSEAWKRAVQGGRQYKFHAKSGRPLLFPKGHELAGEPYYEVVKSDGLLLALLKARLPVLFGDKLRVEQTIKQEPAYDLSRLTAEEKLALLQMKRRLATAQAQTNGEEGPAHD